MALTKRLVKGSKLTHKELDDNFDFLNDKNSVHFEGEIDIYGLPGIEEVSDYTIPILEPISNLIGKGLTFKGTKLEISIEIDLGIFGGTSQDAILTAQIYRGIFDQSPFFGSPTDIGFWATIDYSYYNIELVSTGDIVLNSYSKKTIDTSETYNFNPEDSGKEHKIKIVEYSDLAVEDEIEVYHADTSGSITQIQPSGGGGGGGGGSLPYLSDLVGYNVVYDEAITPNSISFIVESTTHSDFNDITWVLEQEGVVVASGGFTELDPDNFTTYEIITITTTDFNYNENDWYVLRIIDTIPYVDDVDDIIQQVIFKTAPWETGGFTVWNSESYSVIDGSIFDNAVSMGKYGNLIFEPNSSSQRIINLRDGGGYHTLRTIPDENDVKETDVLIIPSSYGMNGYVDSVKIVGLNYVDIPNSYGAESPAAWIDGTVVTFESIVIYTQ